MIPATESIVAVARPKRRTIVVFIDGYEVEFRLSEAKHIVKEMAGALEALELALRLARVE